MIVSVVTHLCALPPYCPTVFIGTADRLRGFVSIDTTGARRFPCPAPGTTESYHSMEQQG